MLLEPPSRERPWGQGFGYAPSMSQLIETLVRDIINGEALD